MCVGSLKVVFVVLTSCLFVVGALGGMVFAGGFGCAVLVGGVLLFV